LHTDLTDGQITFADYFRFAVEQHVDHLVFLEHIRRAPSYDPNAFAQQVRDHSIRSNIRATVGFEAKILSGGELDVSDDAIRIARVIGIAEHGKALTVDAFIESLRVILKNYPSRYPDVQFVWVHPGLMLQRLGVLNEHRSVYQELLREAGKFGVLVEKNLRYGLLSQETIDALPEIDPLLGADAHNLHDLERWLKIIDSV
jgi:histidinol phosphatase-like PHP family hydrolase